MMARGGDGPGRESTFAEPSPVGADDFRPCFAGRDSTLTEG